MTLDIKFIKICKREGLIPTFIYQCLLIKQQNPKLERLISTIVMQNEVQTKHREKHNLKKDIKATSYQIQRLLPTLVYTTVLYLINLTIRSKVKSIAKCHERKLIKFRPQYHTQLNTNNVKVNKHIINNFSSCVLSLEEITALSSGLNQHIPYKVDKNSINTAFELFYQNLLKDNSHLLQHTF